MPTVIITVLLTLDLNLQKEKESTIYFDFINGKKKMLYKILGKEKLTFCVYSNNCLTCTEDICQKANCHHQSYLEFFLMGTWALVESQEECSPFFSFSSSQYSIISLRYYNNCRNSIQSIRLSQWLSGEESAYQCRICAFDPWSWKIPWRRKWQPTPVFLSANPHGQCSLVDYSPWGCRVGQDLATEP